VNSEQESARLLTVDFSPFTVVETRHLIRKVQQLNGMCHPDRKARRAQPRADLHQAAWIPRHDKIRLWLGCREAPDLAVENGPSHTGLQHGVDPGAAAAPVESGQKMKPQRWHGAQQSQRSFMDALRVLQMAGRIVGNRKVNGGSGPRPPFSQELGNISDLCCHSSRLGGVQQSSVILEQRTAAGTVYHDEIR
jgi:hypothetical protein